MRVSSFPQSCNRQTDTATQQMTVECTRLDSEASPRRAKMPNSTAKSVALGIASLCAAAFLLAAVVLHEDATPNVGYQNRAFFSTSLCAHHHTGETETRDGTQEQKRHHISIDLTLIFFLQAAELAAGLEQTGSGLVYPVTATAWKLTSGPNDARLADQVILSSR
jgi:hypothetical protein